ncbi:MAG: hypothetical protein JOZ96_06465 [Acidobacteria bacterium]|nr:hypothetical protein [Acidobacteriota bacterium]
MSFMSALTRIVVGTSRLGDHMLKQKVSGIIVAVIAFACGAGLAHALKAEPPARGVVIAVAPKPADAARAEVRMQDTAARASEDAVFEGRYENNVYGYSVEIPAGMVGLGARPPAPQHGFGIDLDAPRSISWVRGEGFPKSYVYVDGSYNTLEWEHLDDAVESRLGFLREKGEDVRLLSRTPTRLGGLRAVRAVARYGVNGVEMVSDETVAFGDGGSPVYTLSLSTPLTKYEWDRQTLEAMLKSWRLQPAE